LALYFGGKRDSSELKKEGHEQSQFVSMLIDLYFVICELLALNNESLIKCRDDF
jgi:hypothetical protein